MFNIEIMRQQSSSSSSSSNKKKKKKKKKKRRRTSRRRRRRRRNLEMKAVVTRNIRIRSAIETSMMITSPYSKWNLFIPSAG